MKAGSPVAVTSRNANAARGEPAQGPQGVSQFVQGTVLVS
jgi:hypothetical protein